MKKSLEGASPQPDPAGNDVLLAAEVAPLLRLNVKTVYELAKAGALPCWRLGRHFRFSRRAIVAHLGQCKPAPYREGS
jgi:excisionase family DNA binding protein